MLAMPSRPSLWSLRGLAVTTLVLTFLSCVTLLVLRPARVGTIPGIGDMKVTDAAAVLREKAKLVDNPLCHILIATYRCNPAQRMQGLEKHIALLNQYGKNVPEYLSSQTRKEIESTDRSVGNVLDEERVRVGMLLFAMIALGGAGALALWFGVRRRAFPALVFGTVAPFLLRVDEPMALIFCGHLGVIGILSLFVPRR